MVNTPLLFGINMKMSTLWRKSRYSLIDSAHNATTTLQSANPRFPFITKVFVLWAMLCWTGTVFMAGIWLGKTPEVDTHTDINLKTIPKKFEYNRTFAEDTNQSSEAWKGLFPLHGSFFTHPILATETSTLSVYHQLHCIDGIRQGYWLIYHAANEGRKISNNDLPNMFKLPHFRHCIDLLRQTIMCHADTTVESVDTKLKGVHGFGTSRKCKDWDQLTKVFNKWQVESYKRKQQNTSV